MKKMTFEERLMEAKKEAEAARIEASMWEGFVLKGNQYEFVGEDKLASELKELLKSFAAGCAKYIAFLAKLFFGGMVTVALSHVIGMDAFFIVPLVALVVMKCLGVGE